MGEGMGIRIRASHGPCQFDRILPNTSLDMPQCALMRDELILHKLQTFFEQYKSHTMIYID